MSSLEESPRKISRFSWLSPANIFLILGLIFGTLYCVFIPFNAGFDEETHLVRIYDISGLHFLPNRSANDNAAIVPLEFFTLSYQRRYFQTPAFDLFYPKYFFATIDPQSMIQQTTRSVYPPISFLPQALIAGFAWRVFNLPVIPIAIVCRLAGLLVFLSGVYIAIRLLPTGKWVMLVLGLSPMALYQASTLNIDGYTIAAVFLLTAMILKIASQKSPVGSWQSIFLIGLLFAVALARPGSFSVLPLLLIVNKQQFKRKIWYYSIWGAVICFIILAFTWSLVATPESQFEGSEGKGFLEQAQIILSDPTKFTSVFLGGVTADIGRYWIEWVGVYGHRLGVVPAQIYWLFFLVICAALLSEGKGIAFSRKSRLITFATFLVSSGVTALIMYFLFYQSQGGQILAVQGRYFLPLGILFYLPLVGLISLPERFVRIVRYLAFGLWTITIGLYTFGMAATYYSNCWQSYYTDAPCSQPIYKNLTKGKAPEIEISKDIIISQSFTPVCGPIESVEVWIKQVPMNSEGTFFITLFDSQGQTLAESEFSVESTKPGEYIRLMVHPPARINSVPLKINLRPGKNPDQPEISVATSQSRQYLDGALTINGITQNADLIFHYSCPSPWKQFP